ncbi:MAG TPA: hypothetical protein VFG42_03345 [Baekduia sp.]|uniref:hypothetical protein n=1 Tax=Baekduia sp. TaxID=2600305 RepID=UPI002D783802|nr:hypothetical protein [Baekduia sp.]HET6505804.1 hypothetical protein [Baekduia sp.]
MQRKGWSAGAVAAVAALGLAAGSGTAFAADNGVPAGKAEHAVWDLDVTGTYTVAGAVPTHQREERWVTADAGHTVVTDVASGTMSSEAFQDATGIFNYNAGIDTVFSSGPQPEWLSIWSRAVEAQFERYKLNNGRLKKAGLTTFQGKTVLRLKSPGDVSGDEPGDKVRLDDLVDPDTLAPLRRITDVTTAGGKTLHQVSTQVSFEVVDTASLPPQALRFGDHPGAKHSGGAASATKNKAKTKAKVKVKKKTKAKHKAATRKASSRR